MPAKRYFRTLAPFWDRYDSAFAAVLLGMIALGYATFVNTISLSGVLVAWDDFVRNSGLLALLTAWTAIIGLYRLRHRPEKTRPSVREDFDELEQEDGADFGLRNFGPGPALYVQAVATVEEEQDQEEVTRLRVHEPPLHLREGDFASLAFHADEDWVSQMSDKYDIDRSDEERSEQENQPTVNLYYSYVSESGARTPTNVSPDRDDADLLDQLKDTETCPRCIELSQVVKKC